MADSEKGHPDVHFHGSSSGKHSERSRKRIDWNRVCFFISYLQKQSSQLPDRQTIARLVGRDYEEDQDAFDRTISRKSCINAEYGGFLSHDDAIHNVSKLALKIGQKEGGVLRDIVRFQGRRCDLLTWFDPTEKFEVHAEVRMSPKDVQVVPRKLWDREISEHWTYCRIRLSFKGGRIRVEMQPHHDGHKYGLDADRYVEYMDRVLGLLGKILDYDPLPLLEVIKFDLQQDHRCETYDLEHNRKLIYGILGLQEYAIWRDDRPEANHRKELMLLNREGVGYVHPAASILSNDIAQKSEELGSLVSVGRLARDLRFQVNETYPHLKELMINTSEFHGKVADWNADQQENLATFEKKVNAKLDVTQAISLDTQVKVDENMSLVAAAMGTISNNTEEIARNTSETGQWMALVSESIQTQSMVIMEVSDILYELSTQHEEWKEVNRETKLDIISRLDGVELSMTEIHQEVSEHFEVSYNGLYQFYRYWRNGHGESEKRSTQNGHQIKKNDVDDEILQRVKQTIITHPGLNTRAVIKETTGGSKPINDALRYLRQSQQVEVKWVKNSIVYHPARSNGHRNGKSNGKSNGTSNGIAHNGSVPHGTGGGGN